VTAKTEVAAVDLRARRILEPEPGGQCPRPVSPRPWGLARMEPPYYAQPVEMGRHGTGTGTRPSTGTSHDGRQDADEGQDSDQD